MALVAYINILKVASCALVCDPGFPGFPGFPGGFPGTFPVGAGPGIINSPIFDPRFPPVPPQLLPPQLLPPPIINVK